MTKKSNATIEDLFPEQPIATIDGKQFSFRAPNLADDVWIKNNIGDGENLKSMMKNLKWDLIGKLAYHLMSEEGRRHFRARPMEGTSETTGELVSRHLTGPEVLLHFLGPVEGVQIMGAITRAMANANPMIADMVKKSLAESKQMKKMVSGPPAPIGGKSLTRSRVNTNGRKRKSKS